MGMIRIAGKKMKVRFMFTTQVLGYQGSGMGIMGTIKQVHEPLDPKTKSFHSPDSLTP